MVLTIGACDAVPSDDSRMAAEFTHLTSPIG